MKNTSLVIAVGALAGVALSTASLQAGPGKAPAPLPPAEMPMDNLLDPIETTVSTGYDTHYMFRGTNIGQEAIWTGIDMSLPLALPLGNFVANWGAWYINPTDAGQNLNNAGGVGGRGGLDDELDIYASIGTTIGAFDVSFGWTHYSYLDSSGSGAATAAGSGAALGLGDQDELGINIGTTVDTPWIPIDLGLGYYYNFDIGDPRYLENSVGIGTPNADPTSPRTILEHYFEASIGTTIDLTDRMAIALGATGSWYTASYAGTTFRAALPIQIAENVVFEPYIGYLMDDSSGQVHDNYIQPAKGGPTEDDLFGGVSLSVSF